MGSVSHPVHVSQAQMHRMHNIVAYILLIGVAAVAEN